MLERSRRTPSWAMWNEDSGEALCTYVESHESDDAKLDKLLRAVQSAAER